MGGGFVVVAGAEVDVAAEAAVLIAGDEGDFGVGFESLDAVNDADPGALEGFGAVEVAFLVEAGLEFDEGGDLFAIFRGAGEGADDARVAGGAVEDLFDGEDLGIDGGFLEEADDGFEGFEGVDEEDIAFGDGVEDGGAGIDEGGLLRGPGGVAELVVSGEEGELHEVGQGEGAGEAVEFVGAGLGDFLDDAEEVAGSAGGDLDADGVAEAAGGEDLLHFVGEVDGVLLLDGDVAVAGDAEGGGAGDHFAGEEVAEEGADEVFDVDEGVAFGGGDGDEAGEGFAEGDEDDAGGAVLLLEAAGDDDFEGGKGGAGAVGVDGEGGEEGEDEVGEVGGGLEELARGEVLHFDETDALRAHAGEEFVVEEGVLLGGESEDAFADGADLLGGGESSVVGDAGAAAAHHGEATDADLEELIEVGAGDGEELESFEEGFVGAFGLLEDALVEFEPGEFAVDEVHGVGRSGALFGEDDLEAEDVVEDVALALHGEAFDGGIGDAVEGEVDFGAEAFDADVADALGVGAFEGVGDAEDGGQFADADAVWGGEVSIGGVG